MKLIATIILAISVVSCGFVKTGSIANQVDRVLPSVVIVESYRALGLPTGYGTGFSINTGHIVTNAHNVGSPLGEYIVILWDGTRLSAKLLGVDISVDVAVLEVDRGGLPYLIPATTEPRVGDPVFAVGNHFARGLFVSRGILGNKIGKFKDNTGGYSHTAAVNVGGSGGPLLNREGGVIGVNTAILNPFNTPSFIGVAYATPIKQFMKVVRQIIQEAEDGATSRTE